MVNILDYTLTPDSKILLVACVRPLRTDDGPTLATLNFANDVSLQFFEHCRFTTDSSVVSQARRAVEKGEDPGRNSANPGNYSVHASWKQCTPTSTPRT